MALHFNVVCDRPELLHQLSLLDEDSPCQTLSVLPAILSIVSHELLVRVASDFDKFAHILLWPANLLERYVSLLVDEIVLEFGPFV